MRFSKSRYVTGLQRPKILWMSENMPEQFDESVVNQAALDTDNAVGDLTMGYYGDYVEVAFDEHGFEATLQTRASTIRSGTFRALTLREGP